MKTDTELAIAFDDVGDGDPALLLLSGWCSNRTVFRPLLAGLADRGRAVAVDWRGHGGSDRPGGDFGTDELVDDVLAVIEAAGVDRSVPVALSHAGWVAIELRRRLGPDRVPGIVLIDWMVLGPPPPFLDALRALQDPAARDGVRQSLFTMWTTGLDIPALEAHISEMAAFEGEMWSRAGREIERRFAAEGTPLAALERLDQPCPTLHVYAQPEDPALLQAQESYATEHSWFQVHRLDARSHFPMFEVPGDMADVVGRFVDSLS